MTNLAERIEQADGPSRELFESAWLEVHHEGYPPEGAWDDCRKCNRFKALLDVAETMPEVYLAAALMLVPEGLEWDLYCFDAKRDPRFGRYQARIKLLKFEDDPEELGPQGIANGNTHALAVLAACVRAKGGQHD